MFCSTTNNYVWHNKIPTTEKTYCVIWTASCELWQDGFKLGCKVLSRFVRTQGFVTLHLLQS